MDGQRIIGSFGLRLLWCALGAMLALSPGTASAQAGTTTDACSQAGAYPGATCQNQTQYAVGYSGSQTQGWAYYCVPDGNNLMYFNPDTNSIAWNNTCFTEAENLAFEGDRKADANFTNWCLDSQSLTVVLACYSEVFE